MYHSNPLYNKNQFQSRVRLVYNTLHELYRPTIVMKIEIDQSGKIEQLNTVTIVAFSNDVQGAVGIRPAVKQKLIYNLQKGLLPKKDLIPILFAVVTYILLSNHHQHSIIFIDEEYTGKNALIKETIDKLFVNKLGKTWRSQIRFGQIGRNSPAHKLAWSNHRKKSNVKPLRYLSFDTIMRIFNTMR